MSAPISDVVDVVVTAESASVQAPGFGKALVLATHTKFAERTKQYSSLSGLLADGFQTTDPVYLAAAAYFSQEPAPRFLKVGRRQADSVTITVVTAANSTAYTITVNGTAFTITSDSDATTSEIATALRAAINGGSEPVTASGSGADVILTADVSGAGFSAVPSGTRMTTAAPSALTTIAADLAAIVEYDTDFYGLILADRASADMQAGAAWASANKRLLFAATAEANAVDTTVGSDTTTLPAILKAAGYDRALTLYHASAATNFIDAAAAGWVLSKDPGSYTFALKTLIGILTSTLTPTQRANAKAKNLITYEERAGVNQTSSGKMASGKNVDQIHGRDWLSSVIAVNIFTLLSSVYKVPFTDEGIGQIEQAAKQAGALGIARNYLSEYETSFPALADISVSDKTARILDGAEMTAVESGAIESVTFNLIVQV